MFATTGSHSAIDQDYVTQNTDLSYDSKKKNLLAVQYQTTLQNQCMEIMNPILKIKKLCIFCKPKVSRQ